MFNSAMARMYCCDPIESIQGFKEVSESTGKYHIHHRFEEMGELSWKPFRSWLAKQRKAK